MDAKITTELQDTLTQNPRILNVYFEEKTGLHHFNHVKRTEVEGKGDVLTVNGKSVQRMSRKQVLDTKAIESSVAEQTAITSRAIAEHLATLIGVVSAKGIAEGNAANPKK